MNFFTVARKLDAENKPQEAAAAYKLIIAASDADIDVYLDLAVLYFVCCDYGYYTFYNLPDDFVTYSFSNAKKTLVEAEIKFGESIEIFFWQHYFDFIVLGNEPFIKLLEEKIEQENNKNLVPYFYLFAEYGGKKYEPEAFNLYLQLKNQHTAKATYIKSILENFLDLNKLPI